MFKSIDFYKKKGIIKPSNISPEYKIPKYRKEINVVPSGITIIITIHPNGRIVDTSIVPQSNE